MKKYEAYKKVDDLWITEVPSNWSVSEFKYYVEIISGYAFKSTDYSEKEGFPIIRIGDVNKSINIQKAKKANPKNIKDLDRFIIKKGDLLLAMTGATIGKNSVFTSDDLAYVNQRVGLLRAKENLSQSFLRYYIDTDFFEEFIRLECAGAAQENISSSDIAELKICIPKFKEQTQIAAYLDHKTQIIDALIEKKEQLIKKLQAQRQAIINEAVTKGLNPNVKMKDSGIKWLGEIPEHWEVVKLKYLLMSGKLLQQDGNHGELHPKSSDYQDDGIPFVMANNINDEELDLNNCKFLSKKLTEKLRIGFSKEEDVLLTHKGSVGRTCIVPKLNFEYIMLTPQITYYRILDKNLLLSEYLHFLFQSEMFQIQLAIVGADGSTRAYVGLLDQKDLKILLPTHNEQIEITNYIKAKSKRLKKLINNNILLIKKLKSYRQSIISEAVTGKIDVRDWRPKSTIQNG